MEYLRKEAIFALHQMIKKEKNTWLGIVATTTVYIIYGLNVVFCKDLFDNSLVSPTALFTIRTGGACILFWIMSAFKSSEKLSMREYLLLLFASALSIVIPQYSTLVGLTMSTPYDASLVATLKPVLTLLIAFVAGKERFRWSLVLGVLLVFGGAVLLVMNPDDSFTTTPLGFLILLLNGIAFAFYLVMFKGFVGRHDTVTMMKWMFLFAFLMSLPMSAKELPHIQSEAFDSLMFAELGFLIVFATFLTYFLMPVGQRNLSSTQYSLFSYVQCVVAALVGTMMGLESLGIRELLASVLFIAGVYVVRRT